MGKPLRDMEKSEFMIALKMKRILPGELLLTPLLAFMFLAFLLNQPLVKLRLELIMEMAGMQVMPLPFSFPLLLMALEPELQLAI